VLKKAEYFILINGNLYLKDSTLNLNHKPVITLDNIYEMERVVLLLHSQNHLGINKMEDLCKNKYFGIKRGIIRSVVDECKTCKFSRPLKISDNKHHIIALQSNERFQIDLIDLKSFNNCNNGNKWLLTVIDIYSKFGFARSLKQKSGNEVERELRKLFYQIGPCKILQSDNGTEFKNSKIANLCSEFNIKHIFGRPNHPKSQGQVERFNQTITRSISKMLFNEDEKIWIEK